MESRLAVLTNYKKRRKRETGIDMGTARKSHATSFKKPPWRDKTTYMQVMHPIQRHYILYGDMAATHFNDTCTTCYTF